MAARYRIWGKHVLGQVKRDFSPEVAEALIETLALLVEDPVRGPNGSALTILPLKGFPAVSDHTYTVNVAHYGLLVYSVKQDYPIIHLRDFIGL